MPLSLQPPPRKHSASGSASSIHAFGSPPTSSSSRYPKVNPHLVATSLHNRLDDTTNDDERDIDQALAELLAPTHLQSPPSSSSPSTSSISSFSHSQQLLLAQQHLPHCKHYSGPGVGAGAGAGNGPGGGARPLSIASISSLGSGSYSSYGSNTSRRVSQAYPLSPLSPTLSEPGMHGGAGAYTGYFGPVAETMDEMEFAQQAIASSLPSCAYCSSVRSNSISSVGTLDLLGAGPQSPSSSAASMFSHQVRANPYNSSEAILQTRRRDSFQLFDSNRQAVLREFVPSQVRHRLSYHLDECWFVHFSPDGKYLASIGLDYSIKLWKDVTSPEPTIFKTFELKRTATDVAWSPNSRYLLVNAGFDIIRSTLVPEFYLIDVESGKYVLTQRHTTASGPIDATAIGWLMDSERFVTCQNGGNICMWNIKGELLKEFPLLNGYAIRMAMIPGENAAVVVNSELEIEIVPFEGEEPPKLMDHLAERPSGVTLSYDASYLALAVKSDDDLCRPAQVVVYDFKARTFLRVLEADQHMNHDFVIMPAFCGPHGEMLCSGSENGKIHFWDVETGEVISMLDEHSKHSGWATFHPTLPGMMATCSDDNHILIWTTKDLRNALQDEDEKWLEAQRKDMPLPRINIKKGW